MPTFTLHLINTFWLLSKKARQESEINRQRTKTASKKFVTHFPMLIYSTIVIRLANYTIIGPSKKNLVVSFSLSIT